MNRFGASQVRALVEPLEAIRLCKKSAAWPTITGSADLKSTDAELIAWITKGEGFRPIVYRDSEGHPTVGVGFNLDRAGAEAAYDKVVGKGEFAKLKKSYDDTLAAWVKDKHSAATANSAAWNDYYADLNDTDGISQTQVQSLLANDLQQTLKEAASYAKSELGEDFTKLDRREQVVLTDMIFNIGIGQKAHKTHTGKKVPASGMMQFNSLPAALKAGDYVGAATAMNGYLWAQQVGIRAQQDIRLILAAGNISGKAKVTTRVTADQGDGTGTATVDSSKKQYTIGDTVSVTARPDFLNKFDHWAVSTKNGNQPAAKTTQKSDRFSFVVVGDTDLAATFKDVLAGTHVTPYTITGQYNQGFAAHDIDGGGQMTLKLSRIGTHEYGGSVSLPGFNIDNIDHSDGGVRWVINAKSINKPGDVFLTADDNQLEGHFIKEWSYSGRIEADGIDPTPINDTGEIGMSIDVTITYKKNKKGHWVLAGTFGGDFSGSFQL